MGSWFSNIHVKRNENITADTIAEYISKMMAAQKYLPAVSAEEADRAFALVANDNSQWISVYSDLLSPENPKSFEKLAAPMSAALHTDVLGIACFDSDYLYLNLINAEEKVDAFLGIGSARGLGIRRMSKLSAWKKKVCAFSAFSESAKKKYIFAEEFLTKVERCLGLSVVQSSASYEYLGDLELEDKAQFLYFKLPEDLKAKDPPKLIPYTPSGTPCFLDSPHAVDGINIGGGSKGLSVYFLGSYVEHEEITFSNVCFVTQKNGQPGSIPFDLKKTQLPDGQWAYYYHDPGYRIQPKVDDRLPASKQIRAEYERSIVVRFTPHGNPRKILDITVALVPDQNPAGQTGWNVWHRFGSKEKYIADYNDTWRNIKSSGSSPPELHREDFD